jgi:low affinity Fe/Cu permease
VEALLAGTPRNDDRAGAPHASASGHRFHAFAHKISEAVGSPVAFFVAVLAVIVWAAAGPACGFSDTWQLVINTSTTVITFLVVFVIQHTQNRDAKAIHLKLDELIRGVRGARTNLVALEELSDEELDALDRQFKDLRKKLAHRVTAPGQSRPAPHRAHRPEPR